MQSTADFDIPDIESNKYFKQELYYPNLNTLVTILEDGLKDHFTEAKVTLVPCPDLSQEPFNLAASGIGGETAIIELGDESYLSPVPRMEKIYDIEQIVRYLGRSHHNSFIFGNGISTRPSNGKLGELVVNTLFLPEANGAMEIINKTHIVFMNLKQHKCDVEVLTRPDLKCTIMGTMFLCEGSTAPVIKVFAKNLRTIVPSDSISASFIHPMREALKEEYGPENIVALGGVYTSSNVVWEHQIIHNDWENKRDASSDRFCMINMPEPIISIFNNAFNPYIFHGRPRMKLNTCVTNHFLSHHNAKGHHYIYEQQVDIKEGVEFLGYFSPAKTLYRIDDSRCFDVDPES
ncbi:ester hydrolase C11orf54 homolog isoform X2 [Anoplolepis gracilipes]